jgi:ABC-type antimicrobial peptide transport system permease subunit
MVDSIKSIISLMGAKMQVVGLPNTTQDGGASILDAVLNIAYFTAGIVAVIVLIIAGFLYVTSNGDPGKVKTAKNAILYTVIGIVFVLFAAVITAFVRSEVSK